MFENKNVIKKLCVVGDRLKDFANNRNVVTISDLETLVESEISNKCKYIIEIGQGLCVRRIKKLYQHILDSGWSDIFQINIPDRYRKSTRCLTHKHKEKNIMVSEPIKYKNDEYECLLMLDDCCAEMSDHVTGQHIQGMVLVEAARQMVIAVTEKYFISNERKRGLNFVTHSMDTTFHQFIFPLQVSIRYRVIEIKIGKNNNLSSTVIILFIQNEILAAEIIFKFSVLDSEYMAEKESIMADKHIQSNFNITLEKNLFPVNQERA